MTTSPHPMSYRDLAHASYHNAIHQKIQESTSIIDNVNCLLQEVSETYQTFCNNLSLICTKFSKCPTSSTYSSDFLELWNLLLQYFSTEAQVYHGFSDDFDILVCTPLRAIAAHKTSQREKLLEFRCSVEKLLNDQSEMMEQLHREYIDQYQVQREKYYPKRIPGLLTAHNNYVLQLVASNKMKDQYHSHALPSVLDELETIQREIIQIFHSSLCHYTGATIKKHRQLIDFQDQIFTVIKGLSPDEQIVNFVRQLNTNQAVSYWRREQFLPPDGDCPEILAREDVISDKLTEEPIQQIKASLMKEQSELLSFISQNGDVINTLKGLKNNGFSYGRSFEKVYELDDDICRKQNEVRMAQVQVSGVMAQLQHIDNKKPSGFVLKDGEDSGAKKIWKKAVFSLKRDKGSKNQSILKNIRKDSFRPQSSPLQSTFQHDDSKIDPVYHLLRCAASKGHLFSFQNDLSDTNSSPTPKYNEMAYQNTNGRLSLIQTAFNMATLSRRRLLLYQTKTKSSSVDDGGQTSDEKVLNVSNINNQWPDNSSPDQKNDTCRSSLSKSTKDYTKSSIPLNNQKDNKSKLKTLLHLAIVAQPPEEPTPKKAISKSPIIHTSDIHKKLNERMKSFSVDNPDIVRASTMSPSSMSRDIRKMSSSYTNTKLYESNVPISPRRRKIMYGKKKSSSLDQEGHATSRRVAFADDMMRKFERSREGSLQFDVNEKSFKNSNEIISKSRQNSSQIKPCYNSWRIKSFSFDMPDKDENIDADNAHQNHSNNSSLSPQTAAIIGTTLSYSPKHDSKRLDRISESQEKSLSMEIDNQNDLNNKTIPKVLTHQKEHIDENLSRQYNKKLGYRLRGNLYVALYDFWCRQKDELNLRAGWKVSAIDISDADWWTGKCNGKFGYFPANYVQAIHQGEHVWRVIHEVTVIDSSQIPVKLFKNQILVQTGSQDGDQILIRTKANTTFWCPINCVTRVIDSY